MTELELQEVFISIIDRDLQQIYNTDGYCKGLLTEGKLSLGSSYGLNKTIKQAKQYTNNIKEHGDYLPKYFYAYEESGLGYLYELDKNGNTTYVKTIDWKSETYQIKDICDEQETIKYDVDGTSVIGLAQDFYRNNPTTNKINFFDNYIKIPNDKFNYWTGTEKDFRNIFDLLNDPLSQKTLGAFYTPKEYVEISTKYVRETIERIKAKNKNYVIIDRCAGTGNLESLLTSKELKHCILNTYEAKEWVVLNQIYQKNNEVKAIIPPEYIVNGILIKNGDALDPNWLETNKHIFQDIFEKQKRGELEIIVLENPPYSRPGANATSTKIVNQKQNNQKGDISLNFIKTAIETMKADHLILFAPIKYWKQKNMIKTHHFVKGHICNRKEFHATEGGISLIYWDLTTKNYQEEYLNCSTDETIEYKIFKYKNQANKGMITTNNKTVYWTFAAPFEPSFQHQILTDNLQTIKVNAKRFTLDKTNLTTNLPIWCSYLVKFNKYWYKNTVFCNFTNHDYLQDKEFLDDVLIWTFYTHNNYITNQEFYEWIKELTYFNNYDYQHIHNSWQNITIITNDMSYGLRKQMEYDTYHKNKNGKIEYDKPILHSNIKNLKEQLQKFYDERITPKLFKYELLI